MNAAKIILMHSPLVCVEEIYTVGQIRVAFKALLKEQIHQKIIVLEVEGQTKSSKINS